MRRRQGLKVAACVVFVTASLSSLAGFAAGCSSSEGSGGVVDPDTGVVPDDGSQPGVDAGGDGAVPVDAAADAPIPDQPYCAKVSPAPKFCDDFDDGDLMNNWDVPTVLGGSMIDLDDGTSTSSPFSYVVSTPKLTTQTSGNASLRKTVLGTVNHVTMSFSALFPVVTFDKGIVAIATLDVSSSHYFTLNLRDDDMTAPAASLQEFVGGVMTRHVLTKVPPINVWTRITIDLDFTAGKANVSFGAIKALDAEPITKTPGTEATIRLGAVYIDGPSDAFLGHFDDVVVDF